MEQSSHQSADPDPVGPPISRRAAAVNSHTDSPNQVRKVSKVT
jgi:hypothetical protein